MKEKILVVDDEKEITDLVALYLENEGFQVYKFYDSREALECARREEMDLAVLDIMMPEVDGLELCRLIRQKYTYPIIMLTAKRTEIDKINGLALGADEYVTKPFLPLELVARVKSQLRRYTKLGTMAQENVSNIYRTGGLVINDDTKKVTVDGVEVQKLTPMQYNILLFLTKNKGRVFSIEQIYESIWNENAINADNTVAVHIRHIREKIEINPREPRYLKVVWGVGYKMEDIKS